MHPSCFLVLQLADKFVDGNASIQFLWKAQFYVYFPIIMYSTEMFTFTVYIFLMASPSNKDGIIQDFPFAIKNIDI